MKKKISWLTLLLFFMLASPAIANDTSLKQILKPCIDQEMDRGRFSVPIDSVEVLDHISYKEADYYRLYATGPNDAWIFYIKQNGSQCEVASSGFPNPDASMLGLPEPLQAKWIRRSILKRIEEVGRTEIIKEIENYQGQFSEIEIRVFKELSLI